MKNILPGLALFILQIYFTLNGVNFFGKYWNPVLFFIISAAIPAYLIWLHLNNHQENIDQPKKLPNVWVQIIWTFIGLLSIAVAYEELRKAFVEFRDFEEYSDVIPQVQALYDRFMHGEFPYTPIRFSSYDLEPIYMPFHWLPSGLAEPMHIDLRLIGFGLLAVAGGVYGWFMASEPGSVIKRIICLVLPSLPLWAFIIWGPQDISVTYEFVIAAYYLILAIGLFTKRLWLITIGIILCLLSRYTFVFWLPFFGLLLLYEKGLKKSLIVWGVVALCFFSFYLVPFYMKDPGILDRGLSYYMRVAAGEWNSGWTLEQGTYFAPLLKELFTGEMQSRVTAGRILQAVLFLVIFIGGLLAYKRWRTHIDVYRYSLIALYVFIMVYYFFAPLTYRYYLFPFLVVSSVLCGLIVLHPVRSKEQ